AGGPPVTALFIQNTNPMTVAPDQTKVKRGFARDDLFVCVHEQFLTETARIADVVLPATMFLEHDDFYQSGGNQYVMLGPKLIEPPGECRSNHEVICALAKRLGARHAGFGMTARELIDWTLRHSGWGTLANLEANRWIDCQPDFDTAHYVRGFNWPDGKFRVKPDCPSVPFRSQCLAGPAETMPPRTGACRRCTTAGPSSRRRMQRTRSASPPRRRATSSTPPSTRRRPRSPRRAAGPR